MHPSSSSAAATAQIQEPASSLPTASMYVSVNGNFFETREAQKTLAPTTQGKPPNRALEDCFLTFLSCEGDFQKRVISICGALQRHSLAMIPILDSAGLLTTHKQATSDGQHSTSSSTGIRQVRPDSVAIFDTNDTTSGEESGAESVFSAAQAPDTIPTSAVMALASTDKNLSDNLAIYEANICPFNYQAKVNADAWKDRFIHFLKNDVANVLVKFQTSAPELSKEFSDFCKISATEIKKGGEPTPTIRYWHDSIFQRSREETSSATGFNHNEEYLTARKEVQQRFFAPEATELREAICKFVFPFFKRLAASNYSYWRTEGTAFEETNQAFKDFLEDIASGKNREALKHIPTSPKPRAQFLTYCHSALYLFEEVAVLQMQIHSRDVVIYPGTQPFAIQRYFEKHHPELSYTWHRVKKWKGISSPQQQQQRPATTSQAVRTSSTTRVDFFQAGQLLGGFFAALPEGIDMERAQGFGAGVIRQLIERRQGGENTDSDSDSDSSPPPSPPIENRP